MKWRPRKAHALIIVLLAFLAGIAAPVHSDPDGYEASAQVVVVPSDPASSPPDARAAHVAPAQAGKAHRRP